MAPFLVNLAISCYVFNFYAYARLVCFVWSVHATEKDTTQHGCVSFTVVFISFWKVTVSYISVERAKRFVMRIISYANVVYFICM